MRKTLEISSGWCVALVSLLLFALYGCVSGSAAFFVSLDPACEGQRVLGLNGYGYARASAGQGTRPLYRCVSSGNGSFVSNDPKCEGSGTGELLAYALP